MYLDVVSVLIAINIKYVMFYFGLHPCLLLWRY